MNLRWRTNGCLDEKSGTEIELLYSVAENVFMYYRITERFQGGKIKEYYAVRSVLCDKIAEGRYYSLQEVPGTKSTWTISKEEKKNKL